AQIESDCCSYCLPLFDFFFQAEDGIRDGHVTGVQTCALPICRGRTSPVPSRPSSPPRSWCGMPSTGGPRSPSGCTPAEPRGRRRSEERRVGKECSCWWPPDHRKEKEI